MIDITTELFRAVKNPPAHVLTVIDFGCLWVDLHDDRPPYTGLVLELEHPELHESWRQLLKVRQPVTQQLAMQLLAHRQDPE